MGSQAKGSEGFISGEYKAPLGYKAHCQHLSPGTGCLERAHRFFLSWLGLFFKGIPFKPGTGLCAVRLSRASSSPLPRPVHLCYKQLDAPALSLLPVTGFQVYKYHKWVHFPSLTLAAPLNSVFLCPQIPQESLGLKKPFSIGEVSDGCPNKTNEGGLIRLDTALIERMGSRIKSAEKLIKQKYDQLHFFQIIVFSRFLTWYKPHPKWYDKLLSSCFPAQFIPLYPFLASHFLTSLSSPLISQNDSWDPRLSWLSAIAPNMQHGNVLNPKKPPSKQPVWKPYCTHCMPEEFLDCLIDTSIKSSATHEAAFLNPTSPWGFISIWDFSPSCSVSYDFHAEGSHQLFLKQQNKQPKAATQLG